MLETGVGELRGVLLQKGTLVKTFMLDTLVALNHGIWVLLHETEALRSDVFIRCMRAASVVHYMVRIRLESFPFTLFRLADPQSSQEELRENAAMILGSSACMRDPFTAKYLSKHRTVEQLSSPKSIMKLQLLSRKLLGSTYNTERLHSRNLKRAKNRVATHRANIKDVALPHVWWTGPQAFMPSQPRSLNSKKRELRETDEEVVCAEEEGPRKKLRVGGGGSWRAFVDEQMGGQRFNDALIKACSERYRALSEEERQVYDKMGRAGAGKRT